MEQIITFEFFTSKYNMRSLNNFELVGKLITSLEKYFLNIKLLYFIVNSWRFRILFFVF